MREKQKRLQVDNLYVIDGTIEAIPFPDELFDMVASGHTADMREIEYQNKFDLGVPLENWSRYKVSPR